MLKKRIKFIFLAGLLLLLSNCIDGNDSSVQNESGGNPLAGKNFWVGAGANATFQEISSQPIGVWILGDVGRVQSVMSSSGGSIPIFIVYHITNRDCTGGHSAGGAGSEGEYRSFIDQMAGAIGSGEAVVVLEPDALALECASSHTQLISYAVTAFKRNPNTYVYIDAGHPNFPGDVNQIISDLKNANIENADGFALNVSNYHTDEENIARGQQISNAIPGNPHFIIDSSRNGNGSNGEWCNPSGRALGRNPTTNTGNSLVDAYLWLKVPGESDGECNGGPAAGQWYQSMAQELVSNRGGSGATPPPPGGGDQQPQPDGGGQQPQPDGGNPPPSPGGGTPDWCKDVPQQDLKWIPECSGQHSGSGGGSGGGSDGGTGNGSPDWCKDVPQQDLKWIPECSGQSDGSGNGTDGGSPDWCKDVPQQDLKWIPECSGQSGGTGSGSTGTSPDWCKDVPQQDLKWIPECSDYSGSTSSASTGGQPEWCKNIPEQDLKWIPECS